MKRKEIAEILEKWHRIYSAVGEEQEERFMKAIYKAKIEVIETISQELLNPEK